MPSSQRRYFIFVWGGVGVNTKYWEHYSGKLVEGGISVGEIERVANDLFRENKVLF